MGWAIMANGKTAAIVADKLLDSPLKQLTATQFIDALHAKDMTADLPMWSEKKKYELEIEPVLDKLRLRDFIEIIERVKGEKKKVEYEIPDWWKWRVNPDPTRDQLAQKLDEVIAKLDRISRL
jgi:hypothetical protein